ncbi:MAG: diaminopimelate decarboxylase [Acidobacteriota bacterium]
MRKGSLCLGKQTAEAVARKHGTPLFVYSRSQILANYKRLHRSFSDRTALSPRICYAMKANPHRALLKVLLRCDAWIDAVSPGEVQEALRAGFPASRILFTGTSLSGEDLRLVFPYEGLTIAIDALEQLEVMREVKRKGFREKRIRVSVRWNPGLGRGFNPRVITAGARSSDGTPVKFGVEENKVLTAFARADASGFLPVALHQHLGSGWVREDYGAVRMAVDKMVEMASRVEREGFSLEYLDFGGGFGPRYKKCQAVFPLDKYISFLCRRVDEAGLKIRAIAVEPGKYLVADAGVLLLRVEYLKESYGQLFACVNAGTYTSLPRSAIYTQAYHEVINCRHVSNGPRKAVTVAGNLCETGDVFAKEIPMPVPRRGDILAVLCAGAYGRSMASHFNLREIPKEILIE